MGLGFADNVDTVYQLEYFPVFNSGTCLTSVSHLKLIYQPLTLLSHLGLWPAMMELYYWILLYIIDYYCLLFTVCAEELIYHNNITMKLQEKI